VNVIDRRFSFGIDVFMPEQSARRQHREARLQGRLFQTPP